MLLNLIKTIIGCVGFSKNSAFFGESDIDVASEVKTPCNLGLGYLIGLGRLTEN